MAYYRPLMHPNEHFRMVLARLELRLFDGSSVADSTDRLWDFYDWNTMRKNVKKLKLPPRYSCCCCCCGVPYG